MHLIGRTMDLSPEQERALCQIKAWLNGIGGPPVFRLFGYAGTGKTTLAMVIAGLVRGHVLFAAFTGKAALVMRTKGCATATTIHALIYRPLTDEYGQTCFVLNEDSEARTASLIIIDEVSMVDEAMARDLLSFGRRVLVLGDPEQLPPVGGAGYFTNTQPNILLTEVHRQAHENPVLRLANDVRSRRPLQAGNYGRSRVLHSRDLDIDTVLAADQVLVGLNTTRHRLNTRIRELRGHRDPDPVISDKLVCLRNDRRRGLFNGGLWRVVEPPTMTTGERVRLHVRADDGDAQARISVRRAYFRGDDKALSPTLCKNSDAFGYGDALTVHKAQGSQWNNVVLFDESFAFCEDHIRWLYVGLTRAAERVTVVLP